MANQAARTQQFASVEEAQAEQQRLAEDKVFVWPHLVVIEMIGALTYILLFGLLSVFINAPLRNLANPEVTPNPSKAPWYFLGLQELLLHMHPALAGVIVPAAVLVGLACIPYIDTRRKGTGIYFYSPKGVPIAVFSAVYTTVWNVGLIVLDEFLPAGDGHGIAPLLQLMGAPAWVAQVVVPSAIMLFIPWSLAMIVK
ncbi:MAG: menaquinol-cytochrome C reductase, partial [Clostridia bacterium]|nr:menaquinol-cytochrome C reductase [Clostridia bacterium]